LSEKPKKPKVVSMCGREIDLLAANEHPAALEARAAKEQLAHWSLRASRYIALFVLDDGELAFCGSMDDAATTLQFAATLHRLAADVAHAEMTGLIPHYVGANTDGEVGK
jgi:hypothetical protein